MSVGYRIRVPSARSEHRASRTVSGADEIGVDVCLLPILGEEEMRSLLRQELVGEGWTSVSGGALRKELGQGLVAELSPDGSEVTVTATTERDVRATGKTVAEAERAAASLAERETAGVKRQSTVRLAKAEGDLRAGLEQVVQRVYVEALQRKARSMGEVQSVHQGTAADGTIEVTIKVRV